MENVIDGSGDIDVIGNIRASHPEVRMFVQMADVGVHAGDQVIQRENIPAFGEQPIAKVRPKKSGSAGNNSTHASSWKTTAC